MEGSSHNEFVPQGRRAITLSGSQYPSFRQREPAAYAPESTWYRKALKKEKRREEDDSTDSYAGDSADGYSPNPSAGCSHCTERPRKRGSLRGTEGHQYGHHLRCLSAHVGGDAPLSSAPEAKPGDCSECKWFNEQYGAEVDCNTLVGQGGSTSPTRGLEGAPRDVYSTSGLTGFIISVLGATVAVEENPSDESFCCAR